MDPRGTTPLTRLLADADIRPALVSRLLAIQTEEPDTILLEEMGLCRGQVRVDVMVVNGLLHGYEIKSDKDSLRRLSGQVELYGKILDRATLVVGFRYREEALAILPHWWEILQVEATHAGLGFSTIRAGHKNPHRDPRALTELLWLEDAMSLLGRRDLVRGFRGKPRRIVWDRVCDHFDIDEIASAVRATLKRRAGSQERPLPS